MSRSPANQPQAQVAAPPLSKQAMQQMLSLDLEHAQTLYQVLEEESEAMQTRDQSRLHDIIARKQELMNLLDHSARQKSIWLKLPVGSPEKEQHKRWQMLLQKAADPALDSAWQEFEQQIAQCKERNDINGKLIARGQRTLKQLLSILRGQQPVEAPRLYTQSGGTQSQARSHTVVKA